MRKLFLILVLLFNIPATAFTQEDTLTVFEKESIGLRIGYSKLENPFVGIVISSTFASPSKWTFQINFGNNSRSLGFPIIVDANIGKNISLAGSWNLRPFFGLGDWAIFEDRKSSNTPIFPALHLGFSIESRAVDHVIVGITLDQTFYVPYSFLSALPTLSLACRLHL